MLDTNTQNCRFAEQTISFVYGELETEICAAFEKHLPGCASCADDLNGFAAVRASIGDWRALEFDSLETPVFNVEHKPKNQFQANAAAFAPENETVFEKLRKIFAFSSPAFAAFAGLFFVLICGGLVAYKFGGAAQIAGKENNSKQILSNESKISTNENRAATVKTGANDGEKAFVAGASSETANSNGANNSPRNSRADVPQRQAVKISTAANGAAVQSAAARKNYKSAAKPKTFDSNSVVAQDYSPSKARRAPKLSSIEDDEADASLRLSDLFDDAGGK